MCLAWSVPAAFTYSDLFAGIGGFHAALSAMGGECVYAVEIDRAAARVYEQNWGIDPLGDITDDAGEGGVAPTVRPHDVLAAGFPCQPFSRPRRRSSLSLGLRAAPLGWRPCRKAMRTLCSSASSTPVAPGKT